MNSTAPGYTYDQTLAPSPVSMAELDELKASVAWTEHDREALRRAGKILVPRAEEILDVWYGFVGSHPHLVHEFVSSILENRKAALDEVLGANITAAGICAHLSAMQDGAEVVVPVFDEG